MPVERDNKKLSSMNHNALNEAKMKFGAKEGDRRFKSKTEQLAEDIVNEGAKQGLHMEIE